MELKDYIWDYSSHYAYLEKIRTGMPPLIITVAITGGVHGKEVNPNLPELPEEQAESTYKCYKAGASVVHIHARDPENPAVPTSNPDVYRKVNSLVREKCPDIIINNTTGGAPGMPMEERIKCTEANPELASLNCGPFMFDFKLEARKPPLFGRPEDMRVRICMPVTYDETEFYAKTMRERGIKPELEVYNDGQMWVVNNLIRKNLIDPPYFIQFVMGFITGAYPTPLNLLMMIQQLPLNSIFEVIGIGNSQIPMNTMGILMGGHVRVGMEDNVYYKRNVLADSNAQFVERIVRLAKDMGREIATPKQARQMLGISETPSQY